MFGNLKDSKNGLVSGQDGKLEAQQNSLLRFKEPKKGSGGTMQRLATKYKGKEERRERNERRGREHTAHTEKIFVLEAAEKNGHILEDGDEEDEDGMKWLVSSR